MVRTSNREKLTESMMNKLNEEATIVTDFITYVYDISTNHFASFAYASGKEKYQRVKAQQRVGSSSRHTMDNRAFGGRTIECTSRDPCAEFIDYRWNREQRLDKSRTLFNRPQTLLPCMQVKKKPTKHMSGSAPLNLLHISKSRRQATPKHGCLHS